MAEYAGLEIRIGGNTTKLTNALKAPTKSAAELQSRIRQATRAMQFDPTDLKNVDTRIKLTGDRMQSLQAKTQLVHKAMEQLGGTLTRISDGNGGFRSIKQIADTTDNLSLKAKQADERFNGLTGTLAKIYEAWNKLSRSEGADFLVGEMKMAREFANSLMSSKTSMLTFESELRNLQQLANDPMYVGPVITDADIERAKQFKALDFHGMFKRGLGLDDMIEEARKLGITLEDSAIANVRELQEQFKSAQDEKKAFDDALSYQQMGTDLQRYNSEIESLSQNMRGLDDSMNVVTSGNGFQWLESEVRRVDAALDTVEEDLKRTGEAMQIDPSNIELAKRYFADLQQQAKLSEEKVSLLDREMRMFDYAGVGDAAKGHQDLAKWIEESAEAARKAKKDLSEQQATVANLDDQTRGLSQTIANMKGDSTLAAFSDGVLQWKKQTEQLTVQMGELANKEQQVAKEQKALGEAQGAFDKAKKGADEYKAKLDELEAEYEQLSLAYDKVHDDTTMDYDTRLGMYNRLGELRNEMEQVDIAYKGAQRNVEEFGRALSDQQARYEAAEDALEQQRTRVKELKQAISDLEKTRDVRLFQNPSNEIEKAEAELRELQGELDEATAKENELAEAYRAAKNENELAKTAKALEEVSQESNDAKASLKEVEDSLKLKSDGILNPSTVKSIGMTLSATLTPAIMGIGYKMVDASSTVDAAYRDMRKTVNGTEEEFEHLRQAAVDFSRTHVTSADQILSIEAIGGELGIATKDLETFAEVISNIDVATNLDVDGAAEALGHLSNILHLTEEDYVGFSDALVRLGNNGASTETEIANIAERIGSMGSIIGMSGSDILAWASSIASTGQNAEAAGTAISKTMSFMETAVAAAGGTLDTSFEAINAAVEEGGSSLVIFSNLMGQTAEEFSEAWALEPEETFLGVTEAVEGARSSLQGIADVAHMSADEFAAAWESDPTAVLKAFIEGLNEVESAGGSADAVLQNFKITSVRQKQAIEGLMQTIGGLDDNLKMSEDAWNGVSDQWGQAGDAANEAAKKAEGFSGQIQILKNNWQIFLSELGEGAAPWVKSFSGVVSEAAGWFSSLGTETKKWIVAVGGIAAAAGPVLSFFGTLGTAKGEFLEWVDSTVSGMSVVKAAFASGGQEAVDSLMSTMTTMGKTKLVIKELALSSAKVLGFAALAAGIVMVGMELKKLYDRYKDHEAATKGLSEALRNMGQAASITAGEFDTTGSSLRALVSDSRDYESRLAGLTKTIEDSNRQYGTYAGQMDYYASTIETLGGKAGRSQEETYKLEAALNAVNDACGTTYGIDQYGNIIDTETGKVQSNTDAILANIDARKLQALIDYYSDDYTQAVGEQAEAQEKLNDAQEAYNTLVSDDGRKEFFENAKRVYGATYDEAQIQAAYNKEVADAEEAIANYKAEVDRTSTVVNRLDEKIASANDGLADANKVLEDAAKAQEEFDRRNATVMGDVTGNMKKLSDSVSKIGKDDFDFNNITEGLEAIHVYANELNGVDMTRLATSFTDVNASMNDVIAALEDGGVQMYTWNSALEQAPEAAEKMGSVTAAAFQSMYEVAGSDLNATMTLIAGLDSMQVGDKTFYIGDNGSIIDSQGKIYDIKADLADIPTEVITAYYVDDQGALQTTLDAKAQLEEVGAQNPTPTISVTDNASAPTKSLQSLLGNVNSYTARPTASLNDYASVPLSNIRNMVSNLDGRSATVTVTTVEKTVKQATGGLNNRPVIPRHATGYIATGPTLTNQGWIGEDGVEAVANWATGGVVMPLSNRKYMLPIADAIADGMASKMGGSTGTTNNYTINGLTVAPDSALARAMDATFEEAKRLSRMGRR